uniref:Uncharacterized protein n=1 Tax=Solanum tuberosum TaxID=4113 RepID=M1CM35_SOLTU
MGGKTKIQQTKTQIRNSKSKTLSPIWTNTFFSEKSSHSGRGNGVGRVLPDEIVGAPAVRLCW